MRWFIENSGWAALFLIIGFQFADAADFTISTLPNGAKYYSNKIIIMNERDAPSYKIGEASLGIAYAGVRSVDVLCRQYEVTQIESFYTGKLRSHELASLASRLYIFTLTAGADSRELLNYFTADPNIELAELYSIPELFYLPNDPYTVDQWYLEHVMAYQAWDIVRGDTTRHAVIGIIDTGVYWNHPDLAANIYVNDTEDINHNGIFDQEDNDGIDADNNGFIDDVIGWDFGEGDNDPAENYMLIHGTPVAGAASEVTDNDFQGAAIGFRARIMPLKVFDSHGYLVNAYQSMLYAADLGAAIINCSWGIRGVYNGIEQSIIDAVHSESLLIIASAGAYSDTVRVYPAAYNHVMAVASTDRDDSRAIFSSYGAWVDICAPGVDILTTYGESGFTLYSGSSFSAAQVSGLAALINSWYPQLTGDEIDSVIRASADPIPGNNGLLGAGRINCYDWIQTTSAIDPDMPEKFFLLQNTPNPFNASTMINYSLPFATDVRIDIYDIAGRRIETLVNSAQESGTHSVEWSPQNISSGIYFYRLSAGELSISHPMVLLK